MISLRNLSASVDAGKNAGAALRSINVALPESGLVALTGPSIGHSELFLALLAGFIRPTSGELAIDGCPTGSFSEKDWDALRARDIAYIKRDENLLPYTTAAANVEFALKMAGVPVSQHRQRMAEAFDAAGISACQKTRVSELSREQVVRLYVARSLAVGYRTILMNDPLDHLDEEATHGVLSLLAACAKDRLVVISTPGSRTISAYADSVLKLEYGTLSEGSTPDGAPTQDDREGMSPSVAGASAAGATAVLPASGAAPSNPAATTSPRLGMDGPAAGASPTSRAGRSQALSCSLSMATKSMKTRLGRTISLCVAGILLFAVVALIISFRTGALDFVNYSEEATLTQYPVVVANSLTASTTTDTSSAESESDGDKKSSNTNATETSVTVTLETKSASEEEEDEEGDQATDENLAQLKHTLESGTSSIPGYTQAIDYEYDFEPIIYTADTGNGLHQANPATAATLLYGLVTFNLQNLSSVDSLKSFHELPACASLYEGNYDIVAGHWPESATDVVIVLDADGKMCNYLSYLLGINDIDELDAALDKYLEGQTVTLPTGSSEYDPATLMGSTLKMVMKSDYYVKDEETGIWENRSYNQKFMEQLVESGTTLTVCGVMKPKSSTETSSDLEGICYSSALQDYVSSYNENSRIVKEQLAHPELDVLTGKTFAGEAANEGLSEEKAGETATKTLAYLLNVDESVLDPDNLADEILDSDEFANFEDVLLSMDTDSIDTSSFNLDDLPMPDLDKALSLAEIDKVKIRTDVISDVLDEEVEAYLDEWIKAAAKGQAGPAIDEFLESDRSGTIFSRLFSDLLDFSDLSPDAQERLEEYLGSYVEDELAPYLADKAAAIIDAVMDVVSAHAENVVLPYVEQRADALINETAETVSSQLSDALGFDVSALTSSNSLTLKCQLVTSLIDMLSDLKAQDCAGNVASFGVVDKSKPTSISLYANSVDAKESLTKELANYNQQRVDEGNPDLQVTYVDMAGTISNVASKVIAATSDLLVLLLLVFFVFGTVAIHFAMRAVTFESHRQAAMLRCLGGGRRHVFALFMFEAAVIGLIFSAIGVLIGALACGPLSNLIQGKTGLDIILHITWNYVLLLIVVGLAMSLIGTFGPALRASRKSPSEYAF